MIGDVLTRIVDLFLVEIVGRRHVGRQTISEVTRRHIAQHTRPHVLSFDYRFTTGGDN
jgi:hypothetical protein